MTRVLRWHLRNRGVRLGVLNSKGEPGVPRGWVLLRAWDGHVKGVAHPCGLVFQRVRRSPQTTPCYLSVSKALKVILDIRYQYAIMASLSRHDSSPCPS